MRCCIDIGRGVRVLGALLAAITLSWASVAAAAEPIRIGLGMALTGGLAVVGKSGLVAMQIWADDVNAKGGLLGRPVKLVYYDDQSNPSTVPGLYTKLLDIDKVDLVVSGYATNMIAPALPVVMQHNMVFFGLFGLAANSQFHYPKYFSVLPTGPDPKKAFSEGFFGLGMAQSPKPQTVAIVAADAEFARNASDGARENAKATGLRIVYDKTYPPATVDFSPIMRSIQAVTPDIVYVASYPSDTVGIIRTASEIGLKTKLFGGGMVGLPTASMKMQLGPLLNGIVVNEWWLPAPTMQFPGVMAFLAQYQAKAASEGVDLLGYFLPPFAYAEMQMLGEAVEATGGLDQDRLGDYIRSHTFKTVVGDVTFGKDGEWAAARPLWVQFQNIKGNELEQFKGGGAEAVLLPADFKSGNLIYPYTDARK
jgi:branched-chain amino acid transport system substrate-binding protein